MTGRHVRLSGWAKPTDETEFVVKVPGLPEPLPLTHEQWERLAHGEILDVGGFRLTPGENARMETEALSSTGDPIPIQACVEMVTWMRAYAPITLKDFAERAGITL